MVEVGQTAAAHAVVYTKCRRPVGCLWPRTCGSRCSDHASSMTGNVVVICGDGDMRGHGTRAGAELASGEFAAARDADIAPAEDALAETVFAILRLRILPLPGLRFLYTGLEPLH
jgi:hypothetical protein